jgi:hypothetical protein
MSDIAEDGFIFANEKNDKTFSGKVIEAGIEQEEDDDIFKGFIVMSCRHREVFVKFLAPITVDICPIDRIIPR